LGTVEFAESRPMRADAKRNYDRIVRVAAESFAENGTQASLDDIACRAGVGPGTLYRHFPNRDCLLAAALSDSQSVLMEHARELETAADPSAAFDEWLFELASHLSTYGGLADSMTHALQVQDSPLYTSCVPLKSTTARLLQRAQENGNASKAASAEDVFTLVSSLAWAAENRGDSQSDLRRMLALVSAGIRS
jgi:AcrR family transcriptional regulator